MQVDFPLDIDIFDDTDSLAKGFEQRMYGLGNAYMVVTGETKSAEYAERLLTSLLPTTPAYQIALSDNSVSKVYATERDLRREVVPRLIVAIGGGKVADFSKRLAYIANIPLLLIPTIIANDGLISPIAVLHDEGVSVSLPGRMPDTVLIDMQIIGSAPLRYLRSAACDLITNLSATNDWERSADGETGRMHHLALQLSRMAAHKVLDCREWRNDSPTFLRAIVYGQMLSGIAMALAGSSRPCSGSEHLISHALDALSLGADILHGEKVGITSRFCLHLQQSEDPLLETFFKEFGVARSFPGCENFTEMQMVGIFAKAREMRPGRSTILDTFTDEELARRYVTHIVQSKDQKI
jgi:glycerol-1-phosphate dehydrogenase [NAD(P)+]